MKLSTLFILPLLVVLTGCVVARDYAGTQQSLKVEESFESATFEPGYVYYYNGPDNEPRALLALDQNYQLKSMFWHRFTDQEQFQSWIREFERMWNHFDDVAHVMIDYRGMNIYAPDNTKIGMVYTKYYRVVAWMGENNEVYVTQPEPSGSQQVRFRSVFSDRDW